jgi:hypothetical protein
MAADTAVSAGAPTASPWAITLRCRTPEANVLQAAETWPGFRQDLKP